MQRDVRKWSLKLIYTKNGVSSAFGMIKGDYSFNYREGLILNTYNVESDLQFYNYSLGLIMLIMDTVGHWTWVGIKEILHC